jgi:predicted TIM-barrel enzyme
VRGGRRNRPDHHLQLGRYRIAGRGSLSGLLPYGDANAIVVDMAREVLPIVERTPVLAGVCGTDPFRLMDVFLEELRRIGLSGVQNFPTVGLFDGTFRRNLEETGMGYGLEVEMIRLAHDKDLLTAPCVFTVDEATAMAEPDDAAYILARTEGVVGFFGASSMERLPTETAMTQNMRRFKAIPV